MKIRCLDAEILHQLGLVYGPGQVELGWVGSGGVGSGQVGSGRVGCRTKNRDQLWLINKLHQNPNPKANLRQS